MKQIVIKMVSAFVLVGASALSQSAAIAPAGDFGPLTGFGENPFGGEGIPTDQTMITTFAGIGGDEVTLAIAATQRFSNPPLTNDGAGTYTAQAGANDGVPGSTEGTLRSTWNWSFFVGISGEGNSTLADYGLTLFYDLDPASGTDSSALGFFALPGSDRQVGNSQNSTFNYLTSSVEGIITAPTFTNFDPLVAGEYSFAIVSEFDGTTHTVAMNVNVVAEQVPAPATLALFGIGLAGLGYSRRNKA